MNIKVIGSGCENCDKTNAIVKECVEELGIDAEIERVTDLVEIVKLGEGVNENHFLKEEAIERTVECLKKYKETADKYNVKELKAFATSATTDAENREKFMKKELAIYP